MGTSPSRQIGTFLVELWWSGKLSETPWIHLGSSWIISEIFKKIHKIVICGHTFHHLLSTVGLLLERMELESIFYETLMYFGKHYSPVWSEDP